MHATGQIEVIISRDDDEAVMVLEAPAAEGYILGRSDSSTNYQPDIDLMDFGAQERGVSRKHAALVRYRGLVHLVDLRSSNGTFLNDERLVPEVPYELHNNDQIILGSLEIVIRHLNRS